MTLIDLQRFHDDLKAAVLARVPLQIDDQPAASLTQKRVDQLHSELTSELSDQPAAAANAQTQNSSDLKLTNLDAMPARYQAALQTFDRTGCMAPVLDGLSNRLIAVRETTQALRWMWYYLAAILLTAYGGLLLFGYAVEPVINDLRADGLAIASKDNLTQDGFGTVLPIALPIAGVFLIMLIGWAYWGGTRTMSSLIGGAAYARLQCLTSTLNSIELLAATEMPLDEAIAVGCDLNGVDEKSRNEVQSLIPSQIVHTAAQTEYLSHIADRRLHDLKFRVPILTIAVVGGVVCACYGILVFGPIVNLLNDLGKAAI